MLRKLFADDVCKACSYINCFIYEPSLTVVDVSHGAIDNSRLTLLALFDVSAAFDSVDHDLLRTNFLLLIFRPCSVTLPPRTHLTFPAPLFFLLFQSVSGITSDPPIYLYSAPIHRIFLPLADAVILARNCSIVYLASNKSLR